MSEIEYRLKEEGVSMDEWRVLTRTLLARGYVSGSDPETVSSFHAGLRCRRTLSDFFRTHLGLHLHHSERFEHFRVMPLVNRAPEIQLETDLESRRELAPQRWKNFTAVTLLLRTRFQDALDERSGLDGDLRVAMSVAELDEGLRISFGIQIPTQSERRSIMHLLRRFGAIETRFEQLADPDTLVVVRPEITTLVDPDTIGTIMDRIRTADAYAPDEEASPNEDQEI